MARRGMWAAIGAFAASPQGRQLLQQAKEYATRPETKQQAQQLWEQVRAKTGGRIPGGSRSTSPTSTPSSTSPASPSWTSASTVPPTTTTTTSTSATTPSATSPSADGPGTPPGPYS